MLPCPETLPPYTPRHPAKPSLMDIEGPPFTNVQSASLGHTRFLHEEDDENLCRAFTVAGDQPPEYTDLDEIIHCFDLSYPFVYSTSVHGTRLPRFQIALENTHSGKAYRLRIRRLLKSEIRRNSVSETPRQLDAFDHDTVLYVIENTAALGFFKGMVIEIRGRQRHTLPGYITMKKGGASYEFWHITRNPAGDSLKEANAKKIQKYGYKPRDEVHRKLLFMCHKPIGSTDMIWKDFEGKIIATETPNGRLDVSNMTDRQQRELIATCWLACRFQAGDVLARSSFATGMSLQPFVRDVT